MAANPTVVQSGAGASTVAAPAAYTQNFSQASAAGTLLVALVAYAESAAPGISTPAGWSLLSASVGGNAGNTLGGRILYYPNNPGGISSIAFTTLTNINGIAVAFFEFANMAASALDGAFGGGQTFTNGSTTPGGPNVSATIGNELWVGLECDVTGQAYTPVNVPAGAGYWVTGPTATSTTGATVVVIRAFYALPGPVPPPGGNMRITGTLAGSIANGVCMAAFVSQNSGALIGAGTGQAVDMLTGQAISVGGA